MNNSHPASASPTWNRASLSGGPRPLSRRSSKSSSSISMQWDPPWLSGNLMKSPGGLVPLWLTPDNFCGFKYFLKHQTADLTIKPKIFWYQNGWLNHACCSSQHRLELIHCNQIVSRVSNLQANLSKPIWILSMAQTLWSMEQAKQEMGCSELIPMDGQVIEYCL